MSIILYLVIGGILIALTFVAITLAVKYFGKKTTDEAIKTTSDFTKKVYKAFCTTESGIQSVGYPVMIGCNGYEIRADLVNLAFEKLEKYWEVFYFHTIITKNPNVIIYQFRVYNLLKPNLSRTRLLADVKIIAEQALTKHLQELGIYIPVDKFIATTLRQDILSIAIAVNDTGFELIAKLRGQSH